MNFNNLDQILNYYYDEEIKNLEEHLSEEDEDFKLPEKLDEALEKYNYIAHIGVNLMQLKKDLQNINKYYIFGTDLINWYNNTTIEQVIKALSNDHSLGTVYKYTGDINDLMYNFSGWGNFLEIDYETYKKLI